jgi:hypothetical protein
MSRKARVDRTISCRTPSLIGTGTSSCSLGLVFANIIRDEAGKDGGVSKLINRSSGGLTHQVLSMAATTNAGGR